MSDIFTATLVYLIINIHIIIKKIIVNINIFIFILFYHIGKFIHSILPSLF